MNLSIYTLTAEAYVLSGNLYLAIYKYCIFEKKCMCIGMLASECVISFSDKHAVTTE